MEYAFLTVGLVVFAVLFRYLAIVPKVRSAGAVARRSIDTIRDHEIGDHVKEAEVQAAAKHVGGLFISVTARTLIAVALPCALVYLGARLNLYPLDAAWAAATDPVALVFFTVVAVMLSVPWR